MEAFAPVSSTASPGVVVGLSFFSSTAWSYAADYVCSISYGLFGVKSACFPVNPCTITLVLSLTSIDITFHLRLQIRLFRHPLDCLHLICLVHFAQAFVFLHRH